MGRTHDMAASNRVHASAAQRALSNSAHASITFAAPASATDAYAS